MSLQQSLDSFEERTAAKVRRGSGCRDAGFVECGIAFDEDGCHAQAAAELDIGGRVTDHDAASCRNFWEPRDCLVEHARKRLAAIALTVIVRTDKEAVDVGAVSLQQFLKSLVHRFHVGGRIKTARDAALIGDDDYQQPCLIEAGNALRHARQYPELLPAGNVRAFRSLLV